MMAKSDITFVIVSYNSARTLRGAIKSCIEVVEVFIQERVQLLSTIMPLTIIVRKFWMILLGDIHIYL